MGSLNIPKESEVIVLSSDEDEDFRKLIKMTSPIKFGKSPSPDVDNEQGDLIVLSSEDELPDLNPRVIEPLIKNHVPETLRIAEPSHSQPSCSTNVRTASRSPPTATKTMDTTDELQTVEEDDQIFVLLEPDDVVPKVYCHIHKGDPMEMLPDAIDIVTFVESLQLANPGKYITLIITGMDKYFKKVKSKTQQEFRDRVLNNGEAPRKRKKKQKFPVVSQSEFQSTMIELQLKTFITYRLVGTAEQKDKLLTQYRKAIAEAPSKRQKKGLGFDWFASADSAGSVKVDKDGKGLFALWTEQLRLFGNVSGDVAQAISTKYPSPKALMEKYDMCDSADEAMDLLRDINVWVGVGQLAKQRKVGPELSRKIYRFFTSTNPERCLGSFENF